MAHFAELDANNIVSRVLVIDNSLIDNQSGVIGEQLGIEYLQGLFGNDTTWKQTSYNTKGGVYYFPGTDHPGPDQSKAFRKNFAGIGYIFDQSRDAFVPRKPDGDFWILDEFGCVWVDTRPKPKKMEVARV